MGKNAPEGRNSVRKSLEAETVWWEENHLEGEQEKVREVGSGGWNTDHVMPYGLL